MTFRVHIQQVATVKTLFCSQDVVDGKETEGQQTEIWNCSGPGDPEGRGIAKEDSQTTDIAENSSIMSFFKTLVSSFLSFHSQFDCPEVC
jgi:hypothetical protein